VFNVMDSLVARKKLHSHIKNYLTSNDFLQQLPSVHQFFQKTIYSSLTEKFKPWFCLRELDLAGTVSLSGFDIIRKIEFNNEVSSQYKRGILCSRSVLSCLAQRLEAH
jgi:hypothetical protein